MRSPGPPAEVRRTLAENRARASSLIEEAASTKGHTVERLTSKVVLIEQGATTIAFTGMLGPSIGHAIQLFCDSLALPRLRWSQAGLPIADFRLVARSDAEEGRSAIRDFDEVAMVGSVVPGAGHSHLASHVAEDMFEKVWRQVASQTGSGRLHSRVLVEPVPRGRDLRVTMVAGEVAQVTEVVPPAFNQRPWTPGSLGDHAQSHVALDPGPRELVASAWKELPQIAYCTIHMEVDHTGAKLRHVELEPELSSMASGATRERLLQAIIDLEFVRAGHSGST